MAPDINCMYCTWWVIVTFVKLKLHSYNVCVGATKPCYVSCNAKEFYKVLEHLQKEEEVGESQYQSMNMQKWTQRTNE